MPQSFNTKWPRWIVGSIVNYFATNCLPNNSPTIPVYLLPEGMLIKSIPDGVDRLELRVEGPDFEEMTQGVWRVTCTISGLLIVTPDPTNAYKIEILQGLVGSLFVTRLPIYRYGDDNSSIDCLTRTDNIKTQPFGFIESTQSMIYSVVEADYYMYFT